MPNLYKFPLLNPATSLLPITTLPAGYTQRQLRTVSTTTERTVQTYMQTVNVMILNDTWIHVLSDAYVREDLAGVSPFQLFHIYTTSLTSPDGDLPYKKGDYFVPTGNIIGLTSGSQHPIRGVQQYLSYAELIVERKL